LQFSFKLTEVNCSGCFFASAVLEMTAEIRRCWREWAKASGHREPLARAISEWQVSTYAGESLLDLNDFAQHLAGRVRLKVNSRKPLRLFSGREFDAFSNFYEVVLTGPA